MLKVEKWPIERIIPYEHNAKIHNGDQVAKIAASIRQFGWTQPIVVDKYGFIIQGHGRRLAAIGLGYAEVPVLQRNDLNESEVRALRLADNRVAIGDYDTGLLQMELMNLDFSLQGIFDDKELAFMEADLGAVNLGAFIEDLDAAVAEQSAETAEKLLEADKRPIAIAKALGFKSVPGAKERVVAQFMAKIEAESKLEGADAFLAHIQSFLESA